ncbi:MAG: helix-turn-helix domain-containing protein [bacterium]
MRPYSEDIRSRVIQAYLNREGSQRQIALRFNVSLGFVRNLLKRYRDTGSITAKKYGGPTSKIDRESLQLILRLVDNNRFLPLSSLCDLLATERHLRISRSTMWRTVKKYRPRKAKFLSASRRNRAVLTSHQTMTSSTLRVSQVDRSR